MNQAQVSEKKKPTKTDWAGRVGADALQVAGLAMIATGLIAGVTTFLRVWTTPNQAIKDLAALLMILFQFGLIIVCYYAVRLGRRVFAYGKQVYAATWIKVAGRPRNPIILPRIPLVGAALQFLGVAARTLPPLVVIPLTAVAYLLMFNLAPKKNAVTAGHFSVLNYFSFTQVIILVLASWLLVRKGSKTILQVTNKLGTGTYVTGMKLAAARAEDILEKDTRPPVLYLRSFLDDRIDTGHVVRKSQEQALASVFNHIGPFIAIGDPGDPLPELGAARLYVGKEWKEVVEDLINRARLVVLRAGPTPGFWWEFEHVIRTSPPEKILVLIPFGRVEYEAFSQRANAFLPHPLPEYRVSRPPDAPIKAMVYFRPDGTSYILPTPPSTLLPFESEVMYSLEAVFAQFNISYKKPQIRDFENQQKVKTGLRRTAGYIFLTVTLGPIALFILWFLVKFFTEVSALPMWSEIGAGIQQAFQNIIH